MALCSVKIRFTKMHLKEIKIACFNVYEAVGILALEIFLCSLIQRLAKPL